MTPATPTTNAALERHYTVTEVAKLWGLSINTVYRIFSEVEGVLRYNGQRNKGKRKYVTTRIPESVMLRVHEVMASTQPDAFRFRKATGAALGKKSNVAVASSRSF